MEGTAAHWVFEQMFAGVIPVVGQSAPNGIIITDEMLDGAEMFVDAVRSMVPAGVRLYVEEKKLSKSSVIMSIRTAQIGQAARSEDPWRSCRAR